MAAYMTSSAFIGLILFLIINFLNISNAHLQYPVLQSSAIPAMKVLSPEWQYSASNSAPLLSGGFFRFGFFTDKSGVISLSVYLNFDADIQEIVWSARVNGSLPLLYPNASLQSKAIAHNNTSSPDFSLILFDGKGNIAWELQEGVSAMNLTTTGNLFLTNHANTTVWQSFDHPTNTILKHQSFTVGMKLTSNSTQYSCQLYPGGLVSSVNNLQIGSDQPLPYWFVTLNGSFDNGNLSFSRQRISPALAPPCGNVSNNSFTLGLPDNQSMPGLQLQSSCGTVQIAFYIGQTVLTADYVTLEDDGLLYAYSYMHGNSLVKFEHTEPRGVISFPFSPISNYDREALAPCDVPNPCQAYSICTPGPQLSCRCPSSEDAINQFQPYSLAGDASSGCQLANGQPRCNTTNLYTFVEVKSTTFITMLISDWNFSTLNLSACLDLCKSDCSCVALFYEYNTSRCLPISQAMSLLNISDPNYVTYLKVPIVTTNTHNLSHTLLVVITPISTSLVAFTLLFVWRHCKKNSETSTLSDDGSQISSENEEFKQILTSLPTKYSYRELKDATENFSKLLGHGAFGSVYEGKFEDGRRLAVKKLESAKQGTKQFLAEVATIGRVDHLNIVRLFGFCLEHSKKLLVYECMANGSLDEWLFSTQEDRCLDWKTRFDVGVGTAVGLAYLHEACTEPILHLDIKPENILLDTHFVAKLADFGLSRLMQRGASRVVTQARGTPGYMAPEFLLYSIVTRKVDIYGLGMVFLELVGGRRVVTMACKSDIEWHFPTYVVAKYREGKLFEVMDKRLGEGNYDQKQAKAMILTALWCIQDDAGVRPGAGVVVKMLQGDVHVDDPPFASFSRSLPRLEEQVSSDLSSAGLANLDASPFPPKNTSSSRIATQPVL